jgi:hypothetical protein
MALERCTLAELGARTSLHAPPGFSPAEGYGLSVDAAGALLGADTPAGAHRGLQTLAQLVAGARGGCLQAISCFDWPRLALRGFTLCYHLVSESMPLLAPNYDSALQLIETFAHLKMNAFLIEPEAVFPYRAHPLLPSRIAFTLEQIRGLRDACARCHVQIIPLIQSIGHAYTVLRHPEYAHLRELPDTTQQYCLCNKEVPRFLAQLMDELIDAFGATRVHIGGDESRRLGQCPRCREMAAREGIGGLYAGHVNRIARHLLQRNVIPMVWGDIMEDHPDILDRIDPAVEVIYWNYDMVDWNRPYLLEMYARSGRTVYGGSAARFGSHGDATFLYQKAMRNNGLMAEESVRNGLAGMIVTDWPKLAPVEVGMVATAYGAESSWSGPANQEEFCERYSALAYGTPMPGLDLAYRLVSEITLKRKDILNPHWAPPFVDQTIHYMPDWLDRMDWSAWDFRQVLAHYTQQEVAPGAIEQMRTGLSRAEKSLRLLGEYGRGVRFHRRFFEVLELAAVNQQVKCAMGLALVEAARLLKYPRNEDAGRRKEVACELRRVLRAWEEARERTCRVLLPGTFAESLDCALRLKFDPEAARYMARFAELLDAGARVHGLLDGSVW